jgi:broad specificity phosphatase PhoE
VQAAALAVELGPTGSRRLVVSSPLLRTRETAAPLARRWEIEPEIWPAVGETPSPGIDVATRGAWLREVLRGRWIDVDARIACWREELLASLLAFEECTVVITHFVAINAAVGYATGNDRIVVFTPDHCSRTELVVDGDRLSLASLGSERITEVR